jgi:hypothetical protein
MDGQHRWVLRGGVDHEHHDAIPRSRPTRRSHLLPVGQGRLVAMVPIGDEKGLSPVPVGQVVKVEPVSVGADPQSVTDSFLINELASW